MPANGPFATRLAHCNQSEQWVMTKKTFGHNDWYKGEGMVSIQNNNNGITELNPTEYKNCNTSHILILGAYNKMVEYSYEVGGL